MGQKIDRRRLGRQTIGTVLVSGGKAPILDGLKEGDLVVPATISVKEGCTHLIGK
jgi:hypothetical protein